MGNTTGVILAAILLTVLPEFLRVVDQYRMVLYLSLIHISTSTWPSIPTWGDSTPIA